MRTTINVIVTKHILGDDTVSDMRVIDAWSVSTVYRVLDPEEVWKQAWREVEEKYEDTYGMDVYISF